MCAGFSLYFISRVSVLKGEPECFVTMKRIYKTLMVLFFILQLFPLLVFAGDANVAIQPAKIFPHPNVFIAFVVVVVIFFWSSQATIKGKKPYIRKIAGLQAVEEAVGRATEMGKPVLFMAGIEDVDNVQTLAGLSVLSHVSEKCAQYDTPIIMPNRYGVTMITAQEVVKESYLRAGRPDAFKQDNIYYVSSDQFALVAHADGLMVREQTAANFYMGSFYAESLILAETGSTTGAIQIAGTANAHQLPFFVAACDYTLIGEELYAASAYLSQDPKQLGGIRGQDISKLCLLVSIFTGVFCATMANIFPNMSYFVKFIDWFNF